MWLENPKLSFFSNLSLVIPHIKHLNVLSLILSYSLYLNYLKVSIVIPIIIFIIIKTINILTTLS